MDEREHIAVDEVQIAAFLRWDAVEVFQLPDVVGGHPAVLPRGGVTVHAALIIAAQQTLHIEFEEVLLVHSKHKQTIPTGMERLCLFNYNKRAMDDVWRLGLRIRKEKQSAVLLL